jgi:hypothetical protein
MKIGRRNDFMQHDVDCGEDGDNCECDQGDNCQNDVNMCPACGEEGFFTSFTFYKKKLIIVVRCEVCGYVTPGDLAWAIMAG